MNSKINDGINDDERAAMLWLSRTDNRVRWSAFTALASSVLFLFTSVPASPSLSLWEKIICSLILSVSAWFGVISLLNLFPLGGKNYRACRRLVRGFMTMKPDDVASSGLPRPLRGLHVACLRTYREPEYMARRIFNRGGPEVALAFLRVCGAFVPLKGNLRKVEPVINAGMEKDAAMVLAVLRSPLTGRSVVLDYSSPSASVPSIETDADTGALSCRGGRLEALLVSGVRLFPGTAPREKD